MPLWSQGGARGGAGFTVSVNGLTELRDAMDKIEKGLRSPANKYIKRAATEIAELDLMPELRKTASQTPTGLAAAYAANSMSVKKDRLVSVRIGGKHPGIRGLKKGIGEKKATAPKFGKPGGRRLATTRNYQTTLAWGSEMGPYGQSTQDTYAMPRKNSGYWVQPAIRNTLPELKRRYTAALQDMVNRYTGYNRYRNAMTDWGG